MAAVRGGKARAARKALAQQHAAELGGVDRFNARAARLDAAAKRERVRADAAGSDWLILRTSTRRTIELATSLAEAGIAAWTPVEITKKRRRGARVALEHEAPMLATFVFAAAAYLPDLLRILRLPSSRHPGFSIFRHDGGIPLIANREVESLRLAEQKVALRARKAERRVVPAGHEVKLSEGGFAGMLGVVEGGDGRFATVNFGGGFRVKIATFLLGTDDVQAA